MKFIGQIIGFVVGLFTQGNNITERTASTVNGVAALGGVVGIAAWLFGPGKAWSVSLNALEVGFVLLVGFVAGEILRRMHPPA